MQLPPVELAGYFPYLPKDGSMSEEERLQHYVNPLPGRLKKSGLDLHLLIFHLQKDLGNEQQISGCHKHTDIL